ncbi:hypothetical protein QEN19_003850 [Hanseniaspora menglaensis]
MSVHMNKTSKQPYASANAENHSFSTTPQTSLYQQVQMMADSLKKQFIEINTTLTFFQENVNNIEKATLALVPACKITSNNSFDASFDSNTTVIVDEDDFSYEELKPNVLLKAVYFQDTQTTPFSYHLINFFINLVKKFGNNDVNIDLLNYQNFKDAWAAGKLALSFDYTIMYFFSEVKNKGTNHHYICLVDKKQKIIHLINPVNDYSVPNETINLKILLDKSKKSANFKIVIAHVPICKKNYNSGAHTLLNIYSLLADMNSFHENFMKKGNDQFNYFVPENELIRKQSYTVMAFMLQSAAENPKMVSFKKYNDFMRNIKI